MIKDPWYSDRAVYSDFNPLDGGQLVYPMGTVLWYLLPYSKPNVEEACSHSFPYFYLKSVFIYRNGRFQDLEVPLI